MLFWGKIVLKEQASIILFSSCRPGLWIIPRTTFLTRFPYPSTNTGTSTQWRFMSRGWHPVRKTNPGQRHKKTLKRSYKAWGPGSTVWAGNRRRDRGLGPLCFRDATCKSNVALEAPWLLVEILYMAFFEGGGKGVIGETFFFSWKNTCFCILHYCTTQRLLCVFQAVTQQLYPCHGKINGTRSLLPVPSLHLNEGFSWAWDQRDVTIILYREGQRERERQGTLIDMNITIVWTF